MRLFTGVLCLSSATLLFFVTLLGARDPRQPRWASDFLVANLYTTGILALGVYGVAQLVRFVFALDEVPLASREAWMSGAVAVAALAAVKALRVKKTLAGYEAYGKSPRPSNPPGEGERPEPPGKPTRPRLAA